MRIVLSTIVALLLLTASAASWSKGDLTRIVISGGNLNDAVEITDREVLDKFAIWSGPGVGGFDVDRAPKPDEPAFIVNWRQGPLARQPRDVRSYLVTMYVSNYRPPRNKYQVLYAIGDSTKDGYVYLPQSYEQIGEWNKFLIYRGVEGNWFHASESWKETVAPLLQR